MYCIIPCFTILSHNVQLRSYFPIKPINEFLIPYNCIPTSRLGCSLSVLEIICSINRTHFSIQDDGPMPISMSRLSQLREFGNSQPSQRTGRAFQPCKPLLVSFVLSFVRKKSLVDNTVTSIYDNLHNQYSAKPAEIFI